jgi:hypothetical protein
MLNAQVQYTLLNTTAGVWDIYIISLSLLRIQSLWCDKRREMDDNDDDGDGGGDDGGVLEELHVYCDESY